MTKYRRWHILYICTASTAPFLWTIFSSCQRFQDELLGKSPAGEKVGDFCCDCSGDTGICIRRGVPPALPSRLSFSSLPSSLLLLVSKCILLLEGLLQCPYALLKTPHIFAPGRGREWGGGGGGGGWKGVTNRKYRLVNLAVASCVIIKLKLAAEGPLFHTVVQCWKASRGNEIPLRPQVSECRSGTCSWKPIQWLHAEPALSEDGLLKLRYV